MIEKRIKITHEKGLHMRPAMILTDKAGKFNCDIQISKDDQTVDGKSIMSVFMLAVEQGQEIVITTDGDDEQEAMDALEEIVNNNFNM